MQPQQSTGESGQSQVMRYAQPVISGVVLAAMIWAIVTLTSLSVQIGTLKTTVNVQTHYTTVRSKELQMRLDSVEKEVASMSYQLAQVNAELHAAGLDGPVDESKR